MSLTYIEKKKNECGKKQKRDKLDKDNIYNMLYRLPSLLGLYERNTFGINFNPLNHEHFPNAHVH